MTGIGYIIIEKATDTIYLATDLGAVSRIIERKYETVKNWFRQGNTVHTEDFIVVYKGYKRVKSLRGKHPSKTSF